MPREAVIVPANAENVLTDIIDAVTARMVGVAHSLKDYGDKGEVTIKIKLERKSMKGEVCALSIEKELNAKYAPTSGKTHVALVDSNTGALQMQQLEMDGEALRAVK